jgi:hypothetical protein
MALGNMLHTILGLDIRLAQSTGELPRNCSSVGNLAHGEKVVKYDCFCLPEMLTVM